MRHRSDRTSARLAWLVWVLLGWLGAGAGAQDGPLGSAVRYPPAPPAPGLVAVPPGPMGGFRQGGGPGPAPPGAPARGGRPRPGSILDPGASGPGISRSGTETFLDGALDPRTGWPFVFLDHFAPRPERVANLWIVQTRSSPQVMGTEPWPGLRVLHFDPQGDLIEVPAAALMAQAAGRPILIIVQGSLTTPDIALGGLLWTHSWLQSDGAILPETVLIAFDWPSQRVDPHDSHDIEEKARRAYVAGYHLARFVQSFPPGSRICLLGQSFGGRVVPTALHLLGGGAVNSQDRDPPVGLPEGRPDLQVRGVILGAASDHDWLVPGRRLDRALLGCEALLNLYNSRDEALRLYHLLIRSGHHRPLGRIGLTGRDLERLGPLAARYEEHDIDTLLGVEHTLLDAVANRQIARWIAPYVWAPDPGPLPARDDSRPVGSPRGRFQSLLRRR